uniref:Uncharacterized protein n=1 Tax=Anopheles dirus TaxID=7168 RepID=A0A182NP93_9DIPT
MIRKLSCELAACVLLCTVLFSLPPTSADPTYQCKLEKRQDESVCVFYNVLYYGNTTGVTFIAPVSKVQHVAFEDSTLEHIPAELLNAFKDLRSLNVVNTNLSTVVIPAKLERLYASYNRISRVIVHQTRDSSTLQELMLDSNQLRDVSNLTLLAKLETLNLSGNKELPIDDTVELGRFKGLDGLKHLLLTDVGMHYLENENDVALPALVMLDLSSNSLLTSSLNVKVFEPMKALEILRLAYNQITDLDVMQLTRGNPNLKSIYLQGSHFKCDLQRLILEHLQKANVETPVDKSTSPCLLGFEKQNDMCCQTDITSVIKESMSQPKNTSGPTPADGNRTTEKMSTGTIATTTVLTTRLASERPASSTAPVGAVGPTAQTVPKSDDGKNEAPTVTLGNSCALSALTVTLTVVKLILF